MKSQENNVRLLRNNTVRDFSESQINLGTNCEILARRFDFFTRTIFPRRMNFIMLKIRTIYHPLERYPIFYMT